MLISPPFLPERAVADGSVVFARAATAQVADIEHARS